VLTYRQQRKGFDESYSGEPLKTRTRNGLWKIIGITSYGKGCGPLNELGVYTRVSMYLNWINITIKKFEEYTSRSFDKPENVFFS
jgi:secreted trypsin-like serine protease